MFITASKPRPSVAAFRRRLLKWYGGNARELPWRGEGRTPYGVLVSEAMLQQTQVATVVPYFQRFMATLPTVEALAAADGQIVLRLWQGLGYYTRARNLHKAAKAIVERHGGVVPRTVDELLALPGVGRYTAGAVASIAYGVRAPILDGNVVRVLCRIDKIEEDPRRPEVLMRLWQRAAELVPRDRPGEFNSAMMELGATVCIPRHPQCLICPVRRFCKAYAAGVQDRIPPGKARKATPMVERDVFRIRNGKGDYLIEQRPPSGRWASLWQFITRQPGGAPPLDTTPPVHLGTIAHALTHRRYAFRVFACASDAPAPPSARWAARDELDNYPMSRPHLKIRDMTSPG